MKPGTIIDTDGTFKDLYTMNLREKVQLMKRQAIAMENEIRGVNDTMAVQAYLDAITDIAKSMDEHHRVVYSGQYRTY